MAYYAKPKLFKSANCTLLWEGQLCFPLTDCQKLRVRKDRQKMENKGQCRKLCDTEKSRHS